MKKVQLIGVLIVLAILVGCGAPNKNLRKCKFTYVVAGQQKTFITCAPACPDHPAWTDLGICRN